MWGINMNIENASSTGAILSGDFLAGTLIGYALKKLVKLFAIVVGLFITGLVYLQYRQIVNINWDKLQITSQATLSTLANTTTQIPRPGGSNDHTAYLAFTNLGIPLTGCMSIGFAIGFMRG